MMDKIKMVMLDFAGTTIDDKTAVGDCLYQAAREHGLDTTSEEVFQHIGTNKMHLYEVLAARTQGLDIESPAVKDQAKTVFDSYTKIMIDYYRTQITPMPGAVETFEWLRAHDIKIAIDTGFHRDVAEAIVAGTGWVRDGLVDLVVDVEHVPGGMGRPAPYMIFHAMMQLKIPSVHQVVKVGDAPADMQEGVNAGCKGIVGVLTGPLPIDNWGAHRHTHIIPSVRELPALLRDEFHVTQTA